MSKAVYNVLRIQALLGQGEWGGGQESAEGREQGLV